MSTTPFTDEIRQRVPDLFEKFERAVESERKSVSPIPASEMADLVMATKGETVNYDHLGKVLAERLRLKEGR